MLDEAARRGWHVRALTRREQGLREGVEWIRGDLHDQAALRELARGAATLVHIAGVVNAGDAAGFLRGNVEGTQNLLDAARSEGVARIVHVSSLSAREPGLSDYGRSKRLAEEAVQVSGLDWTIVRPPAIYGPRDTEMLDLFRAARWGVVPMPPPGRASMIHVDDLARLLLDIAAAHGEVAQRILEPDDGRKGGWSHKELASAIGAAVGRKTIWSPAIPAKALFAVARLDKALRGTRAKLTHDRASYMIHPDWACTSGQRPPVNLWEPRIETREGLKNTAKWYREHGWL